VVYNADRVASDPADAVNIPQRAAAIGRLRGASLAIFFAATAVLLGLPILRRDWLTLALVVSGGLFCLNYSRPLFGFRFKDVPLLKTFFAPTVVAAALVGLPWLHEGPPAIGASFAIVALRAWALLLFNMTLCDLRDVAGDRQTGTISLPVAFGEKRTRALLWALLLAIEALALAALFQAPAALVPTWRLVSIGAPLYLGGLLIAVRTTRSERFYEWWVEGILFLPAVAVLAGRA
jgi:4-hydroxybenzoate polyprenyltransferase